MYDFLTRTNVQLDARVRKSAPGDVSGDGEANSECGLHTRARVALRHSRECESAALRRFQYSRSLNDSHKFQRTYSFEYVILVSRLR